MVKVKSLFFLNPNTLIKQNIGSTVVTINHTIRRQKRSRALFLSTKTKLFPTYILHPYVSHEMVMQNLILIRLFNCSLSNNPNHNNNLDSMFENKGAHLEPKFQFCIMKMDWRLIFSCNALQSCKVGSLERGSHQKEDEPYCAQYLRTFFYWGIESDAMST